MSLTTDNTQVIALPPTSSTSSSENNQNDTDLGFTLDFSEENLSKRLHTLKYRNIQGIENTTITLPKQGIIRFNGTSEVGKTSFFRPFAPLVLPVSRDNESITSFVNTKSPTGTADFIVSTINGDIISLHWDAKVFSNSAYLIKLHNEKNIRKYPYKDVPHEVLDILGWLVTLVDKNHPYCLNTQLDKLGFMVDIPPKVLSHVLNISLSDPNLDTVLKELTSSKRLSVELLEKANMEAFSLQRQLDTPLHDLSELEVKYERLKYLQLLQNSLLSMQEYCINTYTNLSKTSDITPVPSRVHSNVSLYRQYHKLSQFTKDLETILRNSKLEPLELNKEVLIKNVKLLKTFELLTKTTLSLTTNLKAIKTHETTTLSEETLTNLKQSKLHYALLFKMNSHINYLKRNKLNLLVINKVLQSQHLHKLNYKIESIKDLLSIIETSNSELEVLKLDLEKYTCPTCNQLIRKER